MSEKTAKNNRKAADVAAVEAGALPVAQARVVTLQAAIQGAEGVLALAERGLLDLKVQHTEAARAYERLAKAAKSADGPADADAPS